MNTYEGLELNARTTPDVTLVTVTPEKARVWLVYNAKTQRKVNRARVESYARDMKAGRWKMNGETIVFDSTGRLIDGQHRLCAVQAAGVSVDMLVVHGVEPASYRTIDQGYNRSLNSVLGVNGETATTARSLATYAVRGSLRDVVSVGGKLTAPEVFEWFSANRADVEEIAAMIRRIRQCLGRASTIALAAPLYALGLRGVDLDRFVDELCTAYTPSATRRACIWARGMANVGGSGRDARVTTARLLLWLGECFAKGIEPNRDCSKSVDVARYDLKED